VKITIDIPEWLLREIRRIAAQQRVTLRTLVARVLHRVSAETGPPKPFTLRRVSFNKNGLVSKLQEASWDEFGRGRTSGRP
jgi:hypothetical protein